MDNCWIKGTAGDHVNNSINLRPLQHLRSGQRSGSRWQHYLNEFHESHPGITEDVLGQATFDERTPYEWLAQSASYSGPTLDLACGSAPLFHVREWRDWVGLDRSWAELQRASDRGAPTLVSGDATSLPFPSNSFQSVVCSMAIMLLQPLDEVLAEIYRVLQPDGTAVFTLPGSVPVTKRDLLFYAQLMWALRRTHLAYPNDVKLVHLTRVLRAVGFERVSDERVRFSYHFADSIAARRFVDSLYLPAVSAARKAPAYALAQRYVGVEIGVPLRRIVLRRAANSAPNY